MHKLFLLIAAVLSLTAAPTFAGEQKKIGVINFSSCVTESKYGKKEQENIEALQRQMTGLLEGMDKERQELKAKREDTEYRDSLSPQADEELEAKYDSLLEEMERSQQQFRQVLQHAQYQMVQKIGQSVTTAAEKLAEEKGLDYVLHKDACFFTKSGLDLTEEAVKKMDLSFDLDSKNKKLSDNEGISSPDAPLSGQAG
jgi:Skp family chaperone for outer membrane proteins